MGHTIISVYRDDPEWNKHDKWFKLGATKLSELALCEYVCKCSDPDRCERPYPQDIKLVEAENPGCVLVYI